MERLFVRAELQHVAQHSDPAATGVEWRLGQELEGRRDRDRRGVVRVVDERGAAGRRHHGHAVCGMAARVERRRDLGKRNVEAFGDRGGDERVQDEVAPRVRGADAALAPRRGEGELGARQTAALDVASGDLGSRAPARRDRPHRRTGHVAHRGDTGVVGVEDREPVRRQRGRQLRLRARNGLDAAGTLEMGRVHGQHHADLRLGNLRQPGDLALGVHAHLEHGDLVVRLEAEQRDRQARLGVQVALVPQHPMRAGQDVGHDLLGDRLAGRSGDADDAHRRLTPDRGGQLLQGEQRIGDLDERGARWRGNRPLDERRRGTSTEGVGYEAMPVGPLPPKRHEEAAGDDGARVDDDEAERGRLGGAEQAAPGDRQELLDRNRRRHTNPCAGWRRVYQPHGIATGCSGRSGGMAR